ncbi:MAG: MmgE/PrpD family protein [Rhodospirillales bacterium]|jgi:aconitate decarboxylase|nr:MmgE/PrpD family protein [Rhodospirillales bacterium]
MSLTQDIGAYIAQGPGAIPEAAAVIIRSGFIDTVGTMIAGRDEPAVRLLAAQIAERRSAAEEATFLLGPQRGYSADAALLNGTAAHALDYDDVAIGGHPSTVLVPAILAEGERLGVDGAAALRAYLVGYEVWAELIAREPDPHHRKGWHPTGVFGTVGTAAAVAHLHGLDAGRAAHAVALAGSMASGLVANFGSMTKPLHAGRAAASAIEAVRLAARGFTASADAMEHHAGFLAALSPTGRADRESPSKLGGDLRILDTGLSIKRYPMCYATHRAIDGMLALTARENLRPDDVTDIEVSVGSTQASMLRNHRPATGLEAKFSLQFAIAAALVARRVGLGELTDGFVSRPEVQAQFAKLRIVQTDTQCPLEPIFALTDRVVIRTGTGRVLDSGDIRFPHGNAMDPLTLVELREKFLDCAGAAPLDADAVFNRLATLERAENLAQLLAA